MKYGNGCYVLNTCGPTGVYPRYIKQDEYRWIFLFVSFYKEQLNRNAATKSEFCNVTLLMDDQVSQHDKVLFNLNLIKHLKYLKSLQRNETYQREYYKHCIKSKTPNVFLCPNKGMFKYSDEYHKNITRILRYVPCSLSFICSKRKCLHLGRKFHFQRNSTQSRRIPKEGKTIVQS